MLKALQLAINMRNEPSKPTAAITTFPGLSKCQLGQKQDTGNVYSQKIMQFLGYKIRAVTIFTLFFCSYAILFASCSPTHPSSSNIVNAGASSSWSPFHFYSRTLTDGWRIRLRAESDITNYVPIAPSAHYLEQFYQAVYDKAILRFMNADAPTSLIVRLGALSLTLSVGSVPVPWHILALFAKNMLDAAKRGYVAGYSVTIMPPGVTLVDSPDTAEIRVAAGMNLDLLRLLAGGGGDSEWRNPEPVNDSNSDPESDYAQSPPCKRHCP